MPDSPLTAECERRPEPDQTLVVATSGGKDSAAMALWLRFESGLWPTNEMRFVFNDTGHEHPLTLDYLDRVAEAIGAPIERSPVKYTFESLAIKKQRFPSVKARFCTQELKIKPMGEWMKANVNERAVLCQGIRSEESERRRAMPVWDSTNGDYQGFYDIWRPIFDWTVPMVFDIHARHGLEPNPLYRMGAGRVGCWPCLYVRLSELRNAFRRDAALLPRLIRMEAAVLAASTRGTASFFGHDKIPARFHDMETTTQDGRPFTYPSAQAVHDYVLAADQHDLFAGEAHLPTDVPSCMSQYGLCE